MQKTYKCCICHKVLEEKPIRLIKQEYNATGYHQFANVDRYDICTSCYRIFDKWIKKHKEKKV